MSVRIRHIKPTAPTFEELRAVALADKHGDNSSESLDSITSANISKAHKKTINKKLKVVNGSLVAPTQERLCRGESRGSAFHGLICPGDMNR